jgi:orotate phosphoribosyltransferase
VIQNEPSSAGLGENQESTETVLSSRERLRRLLSSEAIVYSTHAQPIVDHAGKSMPWIFSSWMTILSYEGASLAADCLIDALGHFESVQLAGVGTTGFPLVSSIVMRGSGRYVGLYVREAREKWGTRRQVEGVADKDKPVVVIDDCICSGNSLRRACAALEQEGYRIEGALALVDFPWKGGTEWAQALGFKVETLFDVWADLEMAENQKIPGYSSVPSAFDSGHKVPDGLSPADAARWVAGRFLASGLMPAPPENLDREYSASGGIMVSFRDRVSDYRVARDGFYHLDSAAANLARDVVVATVKTLIASKGAVAEYGLNRLKVGVTLFSEHVPATPNQLDFLEYGILMQSTVQPWKLAGALPNTQFFVSEMEQFRHARFTNARLFSHEPFKLFRNRVSKSIESGCSWPAFGVPQPVDDDEIDQFGKSIISRTLEVLAQARAGQEIAGECVSVELPAGRIDGMAVTLYHRGMIGCWTSWQRELDAMIVEATVRAWNDNRWKRDNDLDSADIDVVVSIFRRAEELGAVGIDQAAFKLRLGRDSLAVRNGKKNAVLLAYIPCHNDWSKKGVAVELLRKAGISEPPFQWTTYTTNSWLARGGRISGLESGYPRRSLTEAGFPYRATARLLAYYILDKIGPSGLPDYCYYPISDRTTVAQSAARIILALEALLHAGTVLEDSALREAALAGLRYCCEHLGTHQGVTTLDLPDTSCGAASEVFLINSVYRSGETSMIRMQSVQRLAARVRGFFHADGAITWLREGRRVDADHDLFPGGALCMAASVAAIEGIESLPCTLEQHLSWNEKRFKLQHSWGMVFWQIQGWAAIHELTGEQSIASFVHKLADWALERQIDKNGAFLVDYAPDGPGFHTACVLEALADAWALAGREGDRARARTYQRAWVRGMEFMDRIIIREDDTFASRKPSRSLGGVRQSLTSSTVRIDYVAHTLLALAKAISTNMVCG